MGAPTIHSLRSFATTRSLNSCDSIIKAVSGLGFVQADPIRAPARAQDLILRQRVQGYRAGDLEQQYPRLPLSEDVLHVYGFLPSQHRQLLHPRPLSGHWQQFLDGHASLRKSVLRFVQERGSVHPRTVEKELGSDTCENGWGGQSSQTTMMLEALHLQGLLRIAKRESGQRVYECAAGQGRSRQMPDHRRAEGLCRLLVGLYAPMPLRSLRQVLGAVRGPVTVTARDAIERLLMSGELHRERIDSEDWIWLDNETSALLASDGGEARVRLLAPFDPVVWDRRRFALLWNWEYRFEAYTPVAKRKLGYYALPLLFRDQVIGVANLSVREGTLDAELRFAYSRPREVAFRRGLEQELSSFQEFLGLCPQTRCHQQPPLVAGGDVDRHQSRST